MPCPHILNLTATIAIGSYAESPMLKQSMSSYLSVSCYTSIHPLCCNYVISLSPLLISSFTKFKDQQAGLKQGLYPLSVWIWLFIYGGHLVYSFQLYSYATTVARGGWPGRMIVKRHW